MHITESIVGTHLSNLIEICLERGSDISFHKPQKQAESAMIGFYLMKIDLRKGALQSLTAKNERFDRQVNLKFKLFHFRTLTFIKQ